MFTIGWLTAYVRQLQICLNWRVMGALEVGGEMWVPDAQSGDRWRSLECRPQGKDRTHPSNRRPVGSTAAS